MYRRFATAPIVIAMLWALTLAPQPAWAASPFSSPDGGYSAVFPVKPTEDIENNPSYRTVTELADDGITIWATGHTVYAHDIDTAAELRANAVNFAKEISGVLVAQKSISFSRGHDDKLSALEFTVDSNELQGKGLTVVDGRRVLLIIAVCRKPNDRHAEIDRFLKTLKIAKLKN
jgi:hypothetical protein